MQIISDVEKYLFTNLGLIVSADPWQSDKTIPLYLQECFGFFRCQVLGQDLLFLVSLKNDGSETPGAVKKAAQSLESYWEDEVVYVSEAMVGYNRQRFISHKIPFVIPGNQMYLPMFGVDLREHMKRLRMPEVKKITPAGQAVILFALYNWKIRELSQGFLAEKLGYTTMTLSRVFTELERAGLATIEKRGRKKLLCFKKERGQVWEEALPLLKTPVKQVVTVDLAKVEHLAVAGFSALTQYGIAATTECPVYAVDKKEWQKLTVEQSETVLYEGGQAKLEIWHYAPTVFARKNVVDPLSLYLSLEDMAEGDDLIENEEQMKKFRKYIGQAMRSNGS